MRVRWRGGNGASLPRGPPRRWWHGGGVVAGEADQDHAVVCVTFADYLTDVDHARGGHIGSPSVTNVGVVLPNDSSCGRPVVSDQPVEGVDHVAIAHVPRLAVGADHR